MNLRWIQIMLVCLLVICLQWTGGGQETDSRHQFHIVSAAQPLHLSGISSGVRLYIATVYWDSNIEHSWPAVILEHGRKQVIGNLNQLCGSVAISTGQDALCYVRLRTTPETYDLFQPEEVEIIPLSSLAQMPSYNLTKGASRFKPKFSGSLGVLSNRDYRIGRFWPPRIRQVAHGFVINRWTYTNADKIGYVQEFVGNDGTYSRRVLKKKQARLPHTQWDLPDQNALQGE